MAALLLAGPGDVAVSLSAVAAELPAGAPVARLAVAGDGSPGVAGSAEVALVEPAEVSGLAEVIAPIRAGDRWRPGALAARLRPLGEHPDAVLSVAGHTVVDGQGSPVLRRGAPRPGVRREELLVRPAVEASAVLVRAKAIGADEARLLGRPYGDVVLWGRLLDVGALIPSGEDAADVLVDPARHGYGASAPVEALVAAAADLSGEARRELLWRLYVDAGESADLPVDLVRLLPADGDAREVVADLQWTLERQREALTVEREGWPAAVPAAGEPEPEPAEQRIVDAQLAAEELWSELEARKARIALLEAELRWRDEQLDVYRADAGGARR